MLAVDRFEMKAKPGHKLVPGDYRYQIYMNGKYHEQIQVHESRDTPSPLATDLRWLGRPLRRFGSRSWLGSPVYLTERTEGQRPAATSIDRGKREVLQHMLVMGPLVGRVAIVAGASRGVGKGITLGLGEAGATVYVNRSQPGAGG